jgi:U6 snRNA-associated Sm-like protein LSm1
MASAPPPPPLPPNEAASKSTPENKSSSSSQPINASSRSSVRGVGRGIASSGRDGGGGGRYTTATGGGRGGSQGAGGRGGRNYPHNNSQNNGNHQPTQPAIRPVNEVPYGYLPAFLPGASSMVEQLDRKLLVILRDGRHLVGILRTFDQYSNMVLQDTSERRILVVTKKEDGADDAPPSSNTICYQTDIELGLFIVRGDNVVLFGEVDDEEENIDNGLVRFVSLDEFQQLEEEEEQRKESGGEGGSEPIIWDFDTDLVA